MSINRKTHSREAFTLIEILVVVAIIGLLVAALLPAFSTAQTRAKVLKAQAQFHALDTGIQMYRSESDLDGTYPPSASDNPENRQVIADPKGFQSDGVRVAGGHLLVHAMIGADGLGTPGFRDLDRDGEWWNDTHNEKRGLYELDEKTGQEARTRYGGAGYVDDKMKQSARSLADLAGDGLIVNPISDEIAADELLFTDPWGTPILYYRANRAALLMLPGDDESGIYWQEDNGIITGTDEGAKYKTDGLDFGSGKVDGRYHDISVNQSPKPADECDAICSNEDYKGSFACFICDRSVTVRPTPVRKDSYLFISPGPDARYGTGDDVTNWQREKD